MSAVTTPDRSPRLNPFAFFSDTDFRFFLLIVMTLSTSLFTYSGMLFTKIFPNGKKLGEAYLNCLRQTIQATDIVDLIGPETVRFSLQLDNCLALIAPGVVTGMIIGTVLLLLMGATIYWINPQLKKWRRNLQQFDIKDASDVVTYLENLCDEVGLSKRPEFLFSPTDPVVSALAFGRLGSYHVALTGGLVTYFYTERSKFRAVVLHELAHLYNKDVDKTYFAYSIWYAFIIAALLPFSLRLIGEPLENWLSLSWRFIVLASLVYLTLNSLLRAREIYADVRASTWTGQDGGLELFFSEVTHSDDYERPNTQTPTEGFKVALPLVTHNISVFVRSKFSPHPDRETRLGVLRDTSRLFRMDFWSAFGTGIAATNAVVILFSLPALVVMSSPGLSGDLIGSLIIALIFMCTFLFVALAIGAVGIGAWRETFASLVNNEIRHTAVRLGLGLGLGFLFGEFLSFVPGLGYIDPLAGLAGSMDPSSVRLIWVFVWLRAIILLFSLILFFKWVGSGASSWLEVSLTKRSPRLAYITGLSIASLLWSWWFGPIIFSGIFIRLLIPMVSNLQEGLALADYLGSILAVAAFNPITSLGVTSLWAFPLSAWFWRRRFKMPVQSSWAYLDSSSYPVNFPRQAIFQLKLALIIGLINGLLFCLMIPVIRATILDRLSIYLESINFQYIVLARLGAGAAIAAIMQACGAIIAAVWIKRMGILHGLFSAFISACIMSVGMVSVAVLNTGKIDFFIDLPIFYMVINGGAIISLLFALVPSQIAAWVRSARSLKPTTLNEQIA